MPLVADIFAMSRLDYLGCSGEPGPDPGLPIGTPLGATPTPVERAAGLAVDDGGWVCVWPVVVDMPLPFDVVLVPGFVGTTRWSLPRFPKKLHQKVRHHHYRLRRLHPPAPPAPPPPPCAMAMLELTAKNIASVTFDSCFIILVSLLFGKSTGRPPKSLRHEMINDAEDGVANTEHD